MNICIRYIDKEHRTNNAREVLFIQIRFKIILFIYRLYYNSSAAVLTVQTGLWCKSLSILCFLNYG